MEEDTVDNWRSSTTIPFLMKLHVLKDCISKTIVWARLSAGAAYTGVTVTLGCELRFRFASISQQLNKFEITCAKYVKLDD